MMSSLQHKVLSVLRRTFDEEQAFVAGLSDEERSAAGSPEQWSAKDMLAHVAAWKERMAHNITLAFQGQAPSQVADIERANAEIFEQNRDRPWHDVLADAARAHGLLVEIVQSAQETDLLEPRVLPGYEDRPLWRLVVGNGCSHSVAHLAAFYLQQGQEARATAIEEETAALLADLDNSPGWQGILRYNLACHYALAGQTERALAGLGEALQLNPELTEWSKQDADLASLRDEPGYRRLYREG